MFRNRWLGVFCIALSLLAFSACGEETEPGGTGGAGGQGGSGGTGGGCSSNAVCPAETPTCNEGSCGPCVDDAGCEGRSASRCDTDAGRCVACLGDADCEDGRCAPDNTCVECITAADCGGAACVAGACQQTAGCTTNEECQTGELCVLPDGSAQFGRCEEICDPYGDGGDCEGDDRCALVTFTQELEPVGACLAPNGGAGVQEACQPEECEQDLLCVTYGQGDERCTDLCDPEVAGACGEGFRCQAIDLTAPAGASVGICIPVLQPCETDADCDASEVCSLSVGEDGGLERVCDRAVGTKRGGEDCVTDAECASNFCLSGQAVCYGTCEEAADCAAGSTCVDVAFTLPDQSVDVAPACFPTCTDDAGCNPTQTCSLAMSRQGDALVSVCNPGRGVFTAGQACTEDGQCRSNNCSNGFCFGLCDDDLDCSAQTECVPTAYLVSVGDDGWSYTSDDVWQRVGMCHGTECTTNADCDAGWACRPMMDPSDTTRQIATQRCVGSAGALRGGDACSSGRECLSGLCFDPRALPEDCNDGIDNDGDGDVDCADLDCFSACFEEHDCGDGIDNDGDGAIDCADGDCDSRCNYESNCSDGVDNDGNGLVDCDDPDCSWSCGLVENDCSNGRDDDGDGFTDCTDDDCRWYSICRENASDAQCSDGTDNDGDGFTDCADPDCRWNAPCNTINHEGLGAADLCSDGLDNDGDDLVDCDDPGCAAVPACMERFCDGGNCCADGVDNDGDGRADCLDVDCASDPACNEAGRCSDGLDNDGDRLVDCFDDDCWDAPNCNESRCAGGDCCADGIDNDGDGGIDCVDSDCFGSGACNEQVCTGGNCCGDGVDGDGDGKVDCDDDDCRYSSSCYEFWCDDGLDNDNDGKTDCEDESCFGNSVCAANICFEACEADADCQTGATCAPDAAWVHLNGTLDDYGFVDACMMSPAP